MAIFQPEIAARIVFILGVTNFILGFLIVMTCRCIPGWSLTAKLTQYGAYKRFFKLHCYLWWIFWPSVFTHIVFAISLVGIPF